MSPKRRIKNRKRGKRRPESKLTFSSKRIKKLRIVKKDKSSTPGKVGRKKGGKNKDDAVMDAREYTFAMAFVKTMCAKKAAEMAGLNTTNPSSVSKFLRRPRVQEIIIEEMAMRTKAAHVTADRVVNELAILAFPTMKDYCDWDPDIVQLVDSENIARTQARAIKEISSRVSATGMPSVTIKLYDKLKALELLAKYLGLIGSDSEDGARPTAQEFAIRVRAALAEGNKSIGGADEKPKAEEKKS